MKKFLVAALCIVYVLACGQIVTKGISALLVAPFAVFMMVILLPAVLPEGGKESKKVLLPLVLGIFGLSRGLVIDFWFDDFRMDHYLNCVLVLVVAYVAGIFLTRALYVSVQILWRRIDLFGAQIFLPRIVFKF